MSRTTNHSYGCSSVFLQGWQRATQDINPPQGTSRSVRTHTRTQAEQDRQLSVHGSGNFIQYVHVDDELFSGDDRLVRDIVQKLKQEFLVKKVDYLSKVGDKIQILGRTV